MLSNFRSGLVFELKRRTAAHFHKVGSLTPEEFYKRGVFCGLRVCYECAASEEIKDSELESLFKSQFLMENGLMENQKAESKEALSENHRGNADGCLMAIQVLREVA